MHDSEKYVELPCYKCILLAACKGSFEVKKCELIQKYLGLISNSVSQLRTEELYRRSNLLNKYLGDTKIFTAEDHHFIKNRSILERSSPKYKILKKCAEFLGEEMK